MSALSIKSNATIETSDPAQPTDTPFAHLNRIIERLRDGASRFAALPMHERIGLARSMQRGVLDVAERSVMAGCRAKGIAPGSPFEADEWATGPLGVVRALRLVIESLTSLRDTGNTPIGRMEETSDGRLNLRVFPASTIDGVLFKDITVDVRMQPGVTERNLDETRARFYKRPNHDGRVVMVLGAGNIAAIPALDVITKMFNEGKVCLLKMHPVNAYLGPYIEEAFKHAVDQGFFAVAYGGADAGVYLTSHDGIDEIHITGSDRTYNAIVWGPPGADQVERMARGTPANAKPITAELGNISPVIIVPGRYSNKALAFQAEDLAGALICNASFLCCAPVVVVTQRDWAQRDAFFAHLKNVLDAIPSRKAYYPGARDRWARMTHDRRDVTTCGADGPDVTPWTLLRDLDPDVPDEPLFRNEPFCSVVGELVLDESDPVRFLDRAVEFANKRLWGTLTANLIVPPAARKDERLGAAVKHAIVDLQYGTVTVNSTFNGMSFVFGTPPWGAYPGATASDIQSGTGWVHNVRMLEGIEKVIVRFPLTAFPKPAYFPSHRTAPILMRRLLALEENGSWLRVPPVVFAAARG